MSVTGSLREMPEAGRDANSVTPDLVGPAQEAGVIAAAKEQLQKLKLPDGSLAQ